MDKEERDGLLERVRKEMETTLSGWFAERGAMEVGEELVLGLKIKKPRNKSSSRQTDDTKPSLPRDKNSSPSDGAPFETWHLTEVDWEKLSTVHWSGALFEMFTLLRQSTNGPVQTASVAGGDIVWDGSLTRAFNERMRSVRDYDQSSGSYYTLKQISGSKPGYYAIMRYGFPEKIAPS